jgi:hypothetical protein
MSPNPLRTFHYHACAHAFSARFTRPFEHQIDVQAASALPITGGHGQARVENFQFREFLSFRRAYTHVSGAPQEEREEGGGRSYPTYNTLVTSTLEGLNLLDVVTADRIVARLYSKHREGEAEGSFNMVGSRFEGLRIADCDVIIKLDLELFARIPTYQDALDEFDKNQTFHKIASNPFGDRGNALLPKPRENGAFLCSCVKEVKDIEKACPGVTPVGHHGFHVPGFGTIFLGEIVIKHAQRTLTMIRFEVGSAISGSGTAVQADSNGKPWPPSP